MNISTLETCKLKLVLPSAKICKIEFEKSSVVIEKARNQNFNKFSLSMKIPDPEFSCMKQMKGKYRLEVLNDNE